MPNKKQNLIDRVLDELFKPKNKYYPSGDATTKRFSVKEIKQTLQEELKKIAEDVIGGEYEGFDTQDGSCTTGYNYKREKDRAYFKSIGVEI